MKPIVALDYDGTLGDFHAHFLRFAEAWVGRAMPLSEDNPGLPLHKFMGLSKAKYRQCKLAYRQGGLKRSMPIYEGASDLSKKIRRRKCEVWICTTRPYLHLSNIDPDTRENLRRNKIQYDNVIYGHRKYHDLVKLAGKDRVLMVVDDLPEMIDQAHSLGLPAVVRDQPYNRHRTELDRVHSMKEIEYHFDTYLEALKCSQKG